MKRELEEARVTAESREQLLAGRTAWSSLAPRCPLKAGKDRICQGQQNVVAIDCFRVSLHLNRRARSHEGTGGAALWAENPARGSSAAETAVLTLIATMKTLFLQYPSLSVNEWVQNRCWNPGSSSSETLSRALPPWGAKNFCPLPLRP